MSSSCLLCHQPTPDVHVDLLRVTRPPLGSREGAWRWTYDRHHYCQSCYGKAVRAQTVQQLVKLLIVLLPMAWFMFGGVLLYGVLFSDPATMPLETHLLFAVSSLAGFVLIPYWISEVVKQPWFQALYVATPEPHISPLPDAEPEAMMVETMGDR